MPGSRGSWHPNRTQPADHRGDPVIEMALVQGYLDSGNAMEIPGFGGHQAAVEGMGSLHRAARRMNIGMACWVCDEAGEQCYQRGKKAEDYCWDLEGIHRVHFRIWSKNSARRHVVEQAQGDPANLRYNPWQRPKRTRVDDAGNRL